MKVVAPTVTHHPAPPAPALVRAARRLEHTLARPWLLVGLLALYVPFYVAYFTAHLPFSLPHARALCGQAVLDTRWSYTAHAAQQFLTGCGEVGRQAVVHQQLGDLIYPALYATVLATAFSLLLRAIAPARSRWHLLVFVPLAVAGLDYVENAGMWHQLAAYPGPGTAVPFFSAVTGAKQAFGLASLVLVGALVVAFVVARVTGQRRGARPGSRDG
jgi:hypothetical protein